MDLLNPLPMIQALAPKMPLVGKTALWHTLGMSSTSKHWDLRTELTITLIRSFVVHSGPTHLAKSQKLTLKDPGIKGKMWVSKVVLPRPSEDDLLAAVTEGVDSLKDDGAAWTKPKLEDASAEWTGYSKNSPQLKISEEENYKEMMKEVTESATVLYFHGGAHYMMDPASHRSVCSELAKLTKGRVLNVRYRLAPQNPFPSSLVDALLSYLYLLYPPPGSYHTPVEAKHIVFSGDSAGGNLSVSLLLLLLTLRRANRKIHFNGEEREIPLPGGVALNSPWMDITGSCPSYLKYADFDYLPGLQTHPNGIEYETDDIWPTKPSRKNVFAEDDMIVHPLVSPLAAPANLWEGAPPVWYCTGWELLNDEDRAVASKMVEAGVTVQLEEFEAMPHCFCAILENIGGSKKCYADWAAFISAVTSQPETLKSRAVAIEAKTLKEKELDVNNLCHFTHEVALQRMRDRVKSMDAEHPDTLSKL